MFVLAGPFWICTTLVFAIAISGNISNFLVHSGEPHYKYTPEFRKGKLCYSLLFVAHLLRLRSRENCTVKSSLNSWFWYNLFCSDHSCNSNLQLCLVGASRPLGFPALEKQQGHELGDILLYGDSLCLWLFAFDIRTCCGKTWIFPLYFKITWVTIVTMHQWVIFHMLCHDVIHYPRS